MLDRYRTLCEELARWRVELIDGRIVASGMPTGHHNDVVAILLAQIFSVVQAQGWRVWTTIKLFLGTQNDRYIPDLVVVPPERRMWGDDELHGDSTRLVVEVVSKGSGHDDHVVKPLYCAGDGVPLYLVIDTFRGMVKLMAGPGDDGYGHVTEVAFGKPLDLPEPWGITIDTGQFADA